MFLTERDAYVYAQRAITSGRQDSREAWSKILPAFYPFSIRKNEQLLALEGQKLEKFMEIDFDAEMKRFDELLLKDQRFNKKRRVNTVARWTKEIHKKAAKRALLQAAR